MCIRRGRSELTTTVLAPDELADLGEQMPRNAGRLIDMSPSLVDWTMPRVGRLRTALAAAY